MIKIIKNSGYCSKLGAKNSISITYKSLDFCGSDKTIYSKYDYFCNHASEFESCNCPLYNKAPESI